MSVTYRVWWHNFTSVHCLCEIGQRDWPWCVTLRGVWWHILPSVRCLCEIPQHDWPWSVTLRGVWWHILPSVRCLWDTTAWLTLECDLEVVWWHILPSVRCLCEIPQHDWPCSVTLRWFWWHILPWGRWLAVAAVSEYMAELVGWTALHPGRLIWLGTFLKVPPRQKPPLTSLLQDNWDEILPLIYLHSTLSLSFPPQQNHQPNLVTLCLQRFNAETPKIARHVHVQWILTFNILLTGRFPSKNCQVHPINISVFWKHTRLLGWWGKITLHMLKLTSVSNKS